MESYYARVIKEFCSTRNALYQHDCIGHDDLTARQGYYIHANSDRKAIASDGYSLPNQTEAGFTFKKWQSR